MTCRKKGLLSHLPSLLLTYFLKTQRRRRGTGTKRRKERDGDRTGAGLDGWMDVWREKGDEI